MVVVVKKKGESKDSMFRKFTRSFIEEEVIEDVRRKLFYRKPSLLRKEKEKERKMAKSKAFSYRSHQTPQRREHRG